MGLGGRDEPRRGRVSARRQAISPFAVRDLPKHRANANMSASIGRESLDLLSTDDQPALVHPLQRNPRNATIGAYAVSGLTVEASSFHSV